MFGLLNKFRRDRSGTFALETALVAPFLIVTLFGVFEVGNVLIKLSTVEKGLRAAGMYAGLTQDDPLSGEGLQAVQNLAMRASQSSTAPYLLPEWKDNAPTVTATSREFNEGGVATQVIVISIQFEHPLTMFDLLGSSLTFTRTHEQARLTTL